ncbi:hypothetical protein BCR34DRAFT_619726 [Clohesyomyces aquaticus]|uniref:peptidylprolyl isomerase n=1 Tax=Clohesyomyces aquaticus TaxID=1231657 RepID=A0A1Y1YE17_9PLEO|nr:hypothetical protein BCR34DRAFT_619726 [Clohesyomyces aquaticus]
MARYVVNVVSGGRTTRLLVIVSPEALVSALCDKVKDRLPSFGHSAEDVANIELHLGSADGPLLGTGDLMSDAVPDPKAEELFAMLGKASPSPASKPGNRPNPSVSSHQSSQASGKQFKVRVITPELARLHPDVKAIPLLPTGNTLTASSTLRELKAQIKQHLGLPFGVDVFEELECNCSLARDIDDNVTLKGSDGAVALDSLVVVHGYNEVARVTLDKPCRSSIDQAVNQQLQSYALGKHTKLIGGVTRPGNETSNDTFYLKLPVLSICSNNRHAKTGRARRTDDGLRNVFLDLHTSEVPIEITASNASSTLSDTGLQDCTIGGVLNIYAVKRYMSGESGTSKDATSQGKDGIFRRDLAWELPFRQSERGMANMLSTLRVFSSLTGAAHMETLEQDAILHVFYLLTRFPPAVRAMNVMMAGKTPRPSERAALAQSLYEVLKAVVPLQIINLDETRRFEGSRLLLGLILEKAKHLKVSGQKKEGLPYVDSMKVYDLRNLITMEPVATPVQTQSGLVDRGFYNAFKADGIFSRTNDEVSVISAFDSRLQRVALLSGGVKPQVTVFDVDAITTISRYADKGDAGRLIAASELSDLQYLATLCSRNKLGVLHPSTLPSAEPPVLTLDRNGLLAVYVGRQACGEAGRDINLFRPTSANVEESVDVSIITQLIIPILERRQADGTAVFEAFGDQHRRLRDPDEIIMLAVDCSASMNGRCGFIDVEENEDAFDDLGLDEDSDDATDDTTSEAELHEDPAVERPALDELKTFLLEHESFCDMMAIIRSGEDDEERQENAAKVLKLLRDMADAEIKHKTKNLESTRRRATQRYYRQEADRIEQEISTLKNRCIRMSKYEDALCAWLLYRCEHESAFDEPLTWTPGAAIPSVPKKTSVPQLSQDYEIPNEYLCPISSELMEDPVKALDNFTYERKAIERWFETHETSPFTRQVLTSVDILPNVQVKNQIQEWAKATEIFQKYPEDKPAFSVTFKSPLESWTVKLPISATLYDLHQIAFRGAKGRYLKFNLLHRNAVLRSSTEKAHQHISNNHDVFIKPEDSNPATTVDGKTEEMCLVKVYLGFENNTISYWEPKSTTKTLGSVMFRYYRDLFSRNAYARIGSLYTLWLGITYKGDDSYAGNTRNHWESLSQFFSHSYATGKLANEPAWDGDDGTLFRQIFEGRPIHGAQPLVFKISLSGGPRKENLKTLSRLDVLKQMFDAFINRILAYNFQTHIGLVTFRTKPALAQEITHAVEQFRHQLNSISASGDTALWDAVSLAQDQLVQYSDKYPNAKLRIICLSDGSDTKSVKKVQDISLALQRSNIVLDSFCLGDEDNVDLRALSYLTGGFKFKPYTMEQAMAICELEPVLSIKERPEIILPSHALQHLSSPLIRFSRARGRAAIDEVTEDIFPKRKEHPGLSDPFVELGHFARTFNISTRTDNNLRISRIHSEIRNSGARIHPHYDIYICEPNFGLWKIVMQGPPGSSYANGTFLLYLDMGEEYPAFAPKARFVTPIYHPNINRHGRVCHSIFDRNWTVDTTCKDLVDSIYSLLLEPEHSDPINAVVTLNFRWDQVQFQEEVERHIQKHATKTRAQWKREILGA